MELQPTLENELIRIQPLKDSDFEALFALASDPEVWAQHPNPNRYQRQVFENFFQGAMESGGAFLVSDAKTNLAIGSSRFYDYRPENKLINIGYTFLGKAYWGGKYNPVLKKLMLDYAFQFVEKVHFHVGAVNKRSQIAMQKLGARVIREEEIAYFGEASRPNLIYELEKDFWLGKN